MQDISDRIKQIAKRQNRNLSVSEENCISIRSLESIFRKRMRSSAES